MLTPRKGQIDCPASFKGTSSYGHSYLTMNPLVTNPLSQQKFNNAEYRAESKDCRHNFQI